MKTKKALAAAAVFFAAVSAAGCAYAEDITFRDEPEPVREQTIRLWDPENIPAETVWNDSNPNGGFENAAYISAWRSMTIITVRSARRQRMRD